MNNEMFFFYHTVIAIGVGWMIGLVTGITITLKGIFNTTIKKGEK